MLGDPGVGWSNRGWGPRGARRAWGPWRSPLSGDAHSSRLARAPWGALQTCNGTRVWWVCWRHGGSGWLQGGGKGPPGAVGTEGARGHKQGSSRHEDSGHLVHSRCWADADFQNVLSLPGFCTSCSLSWSSLYAAWRAFQVILGLI